VQEKYLRRSARRFHRNKILQVGTPITMSAIWRRLGGSPLSLKMPKFLEKYIGLSIFEGGGAKLQTSLRVSI